MKKNSKLTKGLCMVMAAVMLIGCSFAYFTDYASTQANGTAGTVAVSMDSNINLLDPDGKDIINPGDMRDGSFTVTNEGNKSIDVRTTIALTTQSNAGFDLSFSGSEAEQSEYDLYLREDVELVEGRGYMPKAGAQPLQVKSIDKDVITYVLPEYALNGNSDKYDEVETVDGVAAFTHNYDFVMVMKGEAGNEWQNSAVSIDVIVEAKQHENTGAGWNVVAQENVTVGSIDKSVVKGEVVITEIEGANTPDADKTTYIPVISKNENGEDLNATSSLIEGEKAEELLDALEEAGLANKEDVDLLIDVESDDFDGMADTTFDVSDLAEDGDTAVIMHYDETKGEWEYIATETVVDGKVNGDFSSYSPVAIQIIKKEEGEGSDAPELNPDAEHVLSNSFLTMCGIMNGNDQSATKIVFTSGAVPAGVNTIDVSEAHDGSILAYRDATTAYITTPDGGKIIAPANMNSLCWNQWVIEEMHFHNFDVSNVESAAGMFGYCTMTIYADDWTAINPVFTADTFQNDMDGINVTVMPLADCAGHEFGGAIADCTHENVSVSPAAPGMHASICKNCWLNQGTEECDYSMYGSMCEYCSGENPNAPVWLQEIAAYDEAGNYLPTVSLWSWNFPGKTATIDAMYDVYVEAGTDMTGYEILGFKQSPESETIVQEIALVDSGTLYVVMKAPITGVNIDVYDENGTNLFWTYGVNFPEANVTVDDIVAVCVNDGKSFDGYEVLGLKDSLESENIVQEMTLSPDCFVYVIVKSV